MKRKDGKKERIKLTGIQETMTININTRCWKKPGLPSYKQCTEKRELKAIIRMDEASLKNGQTLVLSDLSAKVWLKWSVKVSDWLIGCL